MKMLGKRIVAFVIGLMMLIGMCVPSFADGDEGATTYPGSITINNAVEGTVYNVYRIFDLDSYDKDKDAYIYTLNASWKAFAEQTSIKGVYIDITVENGKSYVTWKDTAKAADFAKLAIAYAQNSANKISSDGNVTAAKDADKVTAAITNLPLGYYLVDSSLGALCALTTTNTAAVVNEKNSVPTIDKKLKDTEAGDYETSNAAKKGDTVYFKLDVATGAGFGNIKAHDELGAGLTLNTTSFEVMIKTGTGTETVPADKYTISYAVNHPADQGREASKCSFDIAFDDEYVAEHANTTITITYTAVLNEEAVIAGETNTNTAYLTYGDNKYSEKTSTETSTYMFDIVKTDKENKVIKGAEFTLWDAENGGNEIKVVKVSESDDNAIYEYRVATQEEIANGDTVKIKAGKATVKGLDKIVYYLQEDKAPDGYNRVTTRTPVDLTNGNLVNSTATNNGSILGQVVTDNDGGIKVVNNKGNMLPGTGGIGTYVFYAAGAVIVLAGFLFFFRSRKVGNKK